MAITFYVCTTATSPTTSINNVDLLLAISANVLLFQQVFTSLTLRSRMTYICRAGEVFKEPNVIYICCNQCDEFWSNFVHSLYAYCGVLLCCGLLKVRPALCSFSVPPLPPRSRRRTIVYTSTHTNCAFSAAD